MNTVTRIGIALCFVFGLLANFANAGQPKKSDLEARIASLEEVQRKRDSFPVLPILPQSINGPVCVIGTAAICHRRDGTLVPICASDISPCWEEDPTSEFCPEVCEARGDIAVVDYAYDPCDFNGSYVYVCMPSVQYDPPVCSPSFVPHFNSQNVNDGWGCELSFENGHLSRSVFEALLFESTRTNFLFNEIVNESQ